MPSASILAHPMGCRFPVTKQVRTSSRSCTTEIQMVSWLNYKQQCNKFWHCIVHRQGNAMYHTLMKAEQLWINCVTPLHRIYRDCGNALKVVPVLEFCYKLTLSRARKVLIRVSQNEHTLSSCSNCLTPGRHSSPTPALSALAI